MTLRERLAHHAAQFALKAGGTEVFANMGIALSNFSSPPRRGTRQLLDATNTMPWFRAAVQKVSWSVATNHWRLFVAQRDGKAIRADILAKSHDTRGRQALIKRGLKSMELREVEDNAFFNFLRVGCPPFFDGLIAQQLTQQYLDVAGESLWVLERGSIGGRQNRGVPVSYWVIPPSWVQSTPTLTDPYFHIVSGTGSRYIHRDDTLWQYQPNLVDPYSRGTGLGHTLGDELETDEYAAKYMKAFFYNDGRVPFLISMPEAHTDEVKRTETWWNTKHQGFGRWWKPGFINRKVEVHQFGQSIKDIGMREIREFERDAILRVYGFPPEIFGITESSNRATAEAAKFIYAEHVVEPRLEFRRSALQGIAGEFDERLIVDFVSPLPDDRQHTLEVTKAHPWAFKGDEIREMANHPMLEDGAGQVHEVPFNLVTKRRLDEDVMGGDVDSEGVATGEDAITTPDISLNGAQVASLLQILVMVASSQLPRASGVNLIMVAFALDQATAERIMGPIGTTFMIEEPETVEETEDAVRAVRGVLVKSGIIQEHRAERTGPKKQFGKDDIDVLIGRVSAKSVSSKAQKVIKMTVEHFGEEVMGEAGVDASFDMSDPAVTDFLRTWAGDRIAGRVHQTTTDQLRSTLEDGVKAGETQSQLADRVKHVFSVASKSRAEAIAHTETHRAANFGALEGMSQAGVEKKEWLATQDNVVRDTHSELDGTVIDVDEEFVSSSGATAMFPGDFGVAEEDINCRCGVLSVFEEKTTKEARMVQWKAQEASRAPFARQLQRALKAGFAEQERQALKALAALS